MTPDPEDGDFAPALKLFLQAEYDEREGDLTPERVHARLHALQPLTDAVNRHLHVNPGDRVLDLGTGSGLFALAAARAHPDAHVLGIDLSERACHAATRAAHTLGLTNTHFEAADAEQLHTPDESHHAVLSGFALNLMPDRAAALREAARVLHPGGHLVIAESHRPGDHAPGTGPRDPQMIQDAAAHAGFTPTAQEDVTPTVHDAAHHHAWPWGGNPDPHARFLIHAYRKP